MKVYIAGPLSEKHERKFLEKIDRLCKNKKIDTFLPHRDCGIYKNNKDIKKISDIDVKEIHKSDILIGVLNGICVGAGTAWEMGYAEAIGKKVIGLKTDRKIEESIGDISAVIAGRTKIIKSLKELEIELDKYK
jgi:nucleoside 2-deoxyribosyltransferase